MTFSKTVLGLTLISIDEFPDERGIFSESFNLLKYAQNIDNFPTFWPQDNISHSRKGVIRGMHFQNAPFIQAKLISVINGEIYDTVINIDKESKDFGKHESFYLNPKMQLFIPEYFAHGFQCLSDTATISYKCSKYYNKESENGIRYNSLNIKWPIGDDLIISEKDKNLPYINS